RQYLRRLVSANVFGLGGVFIAILGGACTLCSVPAFSIELFRKLHMYGVASGVNDTTFAGAVPPVGLGLALEMLLISVSTAVFGIWMLRTASKPLPYVPPIREQIPSLPADEILLRGSQVSPALPEELLRPAGRQETPAQEMLRATLEE